MVWSYLWYIWLKEKYLGTPLRGWHGILDFSIALAGYLQFIQKFHTVNISLSVLKKNRVEEEPELVIALHAIEQKSKNLSLGESNPGLPRLSVLMTSGNHDH